MALDGTLTRVTPLGSGDVADREHLTFDLQGPSDYDQAGGGESILASFFPFRTGGLSIENVEGKDDSTLASCKFDPSNDTLKFYTAGGAEEANNADLSGNSYRLTVVGR